MRTIACIIARTNSTRLSKKVLLNINGKLLIEHIIDRLKEVKGIDEIYIATSIHSDDKILGEIANRNKIKCHFGSEFSVIDRMLEIAYSENADSLIRVTGDNVFTDPLILEKTLKAHNESKAEYSRAERLPVGVTAEVINIEALKRCYYSIDPDQSEYLLYYIFDPSRYKTLVLLPKDEKLIKVYSSLTVDTPNDLERTNYIFSNIDSELILYKDILDLSRRKKIPFFEIDRDLPIKLINNSTMSYGEFRSLLEERIAQSIKYFY